MSCAAIYQPAARFNAGPGLYTLAEIRALLRHWDLPDAVRELPDGRVVHQDWDPAGGDPEVYAERVRADPGVARGRGQKAGGMRVGVLLGAEQTAEVMAAVEALEADGASRSDAYRELLLRGAWSVSNRR